MASHRRRGVARDWITAEDVATDAQFLGRLPGMKIYIDSSTASHTGLHNAFEGTGTYVGLHADAEVIVEKLEGNHLFFIDPTRKSGRSTGRAVVLWISAERPLKFEVVEQRTMASALALSQAPDTKRPRTAPPQATRRTPPVRRDLPLAAAVRVVLSRGHLLPGSSLVKLTKKPDEQPRYNSTASLL